MKKTNKISRLFKYFWCRGNENWVFNGEWDKLLNILIDKGEVENLDEYSIRFKGGWEVWTSNHPWNSGHLYSVKNKAQLKSPKYLCSVNTAIRLEDFVHEYERKLEENKEYPLVNLIKKEIVNLELGIVPLPPKPCQGVSVRWDSTSQVITPTWNGKPY